MASMQAFPAASPAESVQIEKRFATPGPPPASAVEFWAFWKLRLWSSIVPQTADISDLKHDSNRSKISSLVPQTGYIANVRHAWTQMFQFSKSLKYAALLADPDYLRHLSNPELSDWTNNAFSKRRTPAVLNSARCSWCPFFLVLKDDEK